MLSSNLFQLVISGESAGHMRNKTFQSNLWTPESTKGTKVFSLLPDL